MSERLGDAAAGYLRRLLDDTQWRPLVIKFHNAGYFRCDAVDKPLRQRLSPALFSPPYYPQYNGGIENTQGETKPLLRQRLAAAPV